MKKVFYLFMAALLAVLMIPAVAAADTVPIQVGDIAFIPNSGEASVSKVNLETGAQIARYWTAPRLGDEIDFAGNPAPGVPNVVPPYAWRTSRIAADNDGNAWVLNVGADIYLDAYQENLDHPVGWNYSTYGTYSAADGLVGSLVRIQNNTSGLTTNSDHANPLTFGTDEAVQVFPVGDVGEMPRAIDVEPVSGHIWVGFYATGVFREYSYSAGALTLESTVTITGARPYQAAISDDGRMWFSSRNANPNVPGYTLGVGWFDIANTANQGIVELDPVADINPYAILIDNISDPPVVWATAYTNTQLYKIVSDASPGLDDHFAILGATQLRGMAFDAIGNIWIADTAGGTVHKVNPVAKTSTESAVIAAGANPVGVGADASGNMWAVCRNDNNTFTPGFIAGFDPVTVSQFDTINVGFRPYAYGDFVQQAVIGIQIVKYVSVGGNVGDPPAAPWNDANTAPGPTALVDQTVYFKYVVTNTGDLPLANVAVNDDNATPADTSDDIDVPYLSGDENTDGMLDVTETWIFGPISETATAGLHTDIGYVEGWYPSSPGGTKVTDDDPANYTAFTIGIQIVKYVSVGGNVGDPPAAPWNDANTAPGPTADVGQTVYFKYVVTNTGGLPLANVAVTDDNATPLDTSDDIDVPYLSGDTNTDGKLDLTETWIFGPISETATAGQHTNIGYVEGWYPSSPDGTKVTDDDPANYFVTENFQGCTPGFWKNNWDKHDGSAWEDTGYVGSQTFFSVFARTITIRVGGNNVPPVTNPTLAQALGANGGDINALARAAVAALLNAASPEITYQIGTPAEVIALVQAAIDAGAPYPLAGTLDGYNNAGCVVNQQGLPQEHD